jgi:uracil-DNA glycosylase family 4
MKKKKDEEVTPLHVFQGTKQERLGQLYQQWHGCTRCGLHELRKDADGVGFPQIVFGEGNPDAKILIIGEAPGAEEEQICAPFVGASGRLLNTILAYTSADQTIQELFGWFNNTRHTRDTEDKFHSQVIDWRNSEFFLTNIVACRPPENRVPTHIEVKQCWERLYNIIYIIDPWLIITFGRAAIESLVHKQVEVTKKRGTLYDVEFAGRLTPYSLPVMCCLHPSYLLRVADYQNKTGNYMKTIRDVLAALHYVDGLRLRFLGTPIPYRREPA